MDQMLGDLREHFPDSHVLVRYEDFCASPLEKLRELDAFCGLDPDRRGADGVPASIENRNTWYRDIVPEPEIEDMEEIMKRPLQTMGYIQIT